jgi:hypothetical protein
MSEACGHPHDACCSGPKAHGHDHAKHAAAQAVGHGPADEACGCHGGVPVFDGVDHATSACCGR